MTSNFEIIEQTTVELISKMREKFPDCPYSLFINVWDDNTYMAECRYGDQEGMIYSMVSYNKEISFRSASSADFVNGFDDNKTPRAIPDTIVIDIAEPLEFIAKNSFLFSNTHEQGRLERYISKKASKHQLTILNIRKYVETNYSSFVGDDEFGAFRVYLNTLSNKYDNNGFNIHNS